MNYIIPKMLDDLENGLDKKYVRYFYYGMPYSVSDDILRSGAIFIIPRTENIEPVATGLIDRSEIEIDIVLAIQDKPNFYENAQIDSGLQLINKIMAGKDDCGNLLTDTIEYVIRSNSRDYGIRQTRLSVEYDDKKIEKEDVITATMTVFQERLGSQPVNL